MGEFAGIGSLNCIYFVCLAAGGTYAVLILVTGAFHDIHLPHLDIFSGPAHVDLSPGGPAGMDVDTGNVHVPSLSPITLASFITAFGAFGIISGELLGASPGATLIWAGVAGMVVAVLAHFAFGYFLIAPQGSSEVRDSDVVGAKAEVLVPIPGDSVGEIAVIARGGRITYSARSVTGEAISRGQAVVVVRLLSNVAWVRPESVLSTQTEG